MGSYMSELDGYYEGPSQLPRSVPYPQRPGPDFDPDGVGGWTRNKARFNTAIDGQIRELELAELCPRFSREKILKDVALASALPGESEAQIAAALSTPGPRFDPGWMKLYQFDLQIRALRAQKLP
jgi:hypothetical protein